MSYDKNGLEIGLGDTVALGWADGFDNGTVSHVHADGTVNVFRPFVHTADFSCAGGEEGSSQVMCYIGFEIVKHANPGYMVILRKKGTLR